MAKTNSYISLVRATEDEINKEYNEIIAYEKADFEDEELGKWAKAYIKSIVDAKDSSHSYFSAKSAITCSIVERSAPSSFTVLRPFSSTY